MCVFFKHVCELNITDECRRTAVGVLCFLRVPCRLNVLPTKNSLICVLCSRTEDGMNQSPSISVDSIIHQVQPQFQPWLPFIPHGHKVQFSSSSIEVLRNGVTCVFLQRLPSVEPLGFGLGCFINHTQTYRGFNLGNEDRTRGNGRAHRRHTRVEVQ